MGEMMNAYDILHDAALRQAAASITICYDERHRVSEDSDAEIYSVTSHLDTQRCGWTGPAWRDAVAVGGDLEAMASRLKARGVKYVTWNLDNVDPGDRRDLLRPPMTAASAAVGITVL